MSKKYQVVTTIFYGGEQIEGSFNSYSKAKALSDSLNSQHDMYASSDVRKVVNQKNKG